VPASEQDLFQRLDKLNIAATTHRHDPVFTVEEAQRVRGSIPGGHCKNLFLKDKKGELWLVVALEDTQIDLKSLAGQIGAARLSFAKPELLYERLGIEPGSVTPFALINETAKGIHVVLDAAMMEHELVNYHPLTNRATTAIRSDDLLAFIRDCGFEPAIMSIGG